MASTTPGSIGLGLLRGVLRGLGWILGAIGALLEGASSADRRTGTVDPEVDEDGYLVKPGSTDLHN
jgi:hypothetical protein